VVESGEAPEVTETGFALVDPLADAVSTVRSPAPETQIAPSAVDSWPSAAGSEIRTDAPLAADFASDAGTRPGAAATARSRRKPARVRLQYADLYALVNEYRENLQRGGTFIRTERPLPVGRECVFEVGAPGLDEPIVVPATVTFVATAAPGQEAGMAVEYQLGESDRARIEAVLARV
jgi:type IV pilus assembly protein PilZ